MYKLNKPYIPMAHCNISRASGGECPTIIPGSRKEWDICDVVLTPRPSSNTSNSRVVLIISSC